MCDIKDCDEDYAFVLESGHMVCDNHNESPSTTKYVCKFCKVQVMSKNNFHPILGKQHKKGCPRARNLN